MFWQGAAAWPLLAAGTVDAAGAGRKLESLTGGAQPIAAEERRARIEKAQALLAQRKVAALLVESGSSLEYFTGIRWRRSERTTLAIVPASGEVLVVTPAFEEPSVRETLQVGGDVRPWDEHENPFEKVVQGLKARGINSGVLAAESTIRFFIVAGIRQASNAYEIVPADPIVRACRLVKSPAELALLQMANNVTIEALRQVHAQVAEGMSGPDIGALMEKATIALGGSPDFSLVLLNEASAYPHGSLKPQKIREGSVVLMDCGCAVHGYVSDISRTWGVGQANARQRKGGNTLKRSPELALETPQIYPPLAPADDPAPKS